MRPGHRVLWLLAGVLGALHLATEPAPTVAAPAAGLTSEKTAESPQEPPPQVVELLKLIDDPVVREWLATQRQNDSRPDVSPMAPVGQSASQFLVDRLAAIRQHFKDLASALPTLHLELERIRRALVDELQEFGIASALLLFGTLIFLGFGCEWLFARLTSGFRTRLDESRADTDHGPPQAAVLSLAFAMGRLVVFAVGSLGAFLAYAWPATLREIVLSYLVAFLALRGGLVVAQFLLAPPKRGDHEHETSRLRILPMPDEAASFWYWRIALLIGWLAFGWTTVNLLVTLQMPLAHVRLTAYVLGLGLLAIGLDIAWRAPVAGQNAVTAPAHARRPIGHIVRASLLSTYFLLIWVLWVAQARNLFWLAVVALALPAAIRTTERIVHHLVRPSAPASADATRLGVYAVCLERGIRALLIIGAVVVLSRIWRVDLLSLAVSDTLLTRIIRAIFSAIVLVLLADVIWHAIRATIDRKLDLIQESQKPDTADAQRRARLRTFLPILRNLAFIVIVAMTAMMALSALGVQIGPLLAGAGVVGVAIGFGAQTLVRDVISGMFYLLDDAFRVGEYIQSGSYKGTVESFSLRSVKLRHHRGSLYTVPFGVLGAVQNMSRDWVIDKLVVGITYDSDIDKAKKLIKQVGQELASDPAFAPHIIEPLKMQGVAEFGDFAVQIGMKMMTKPGEQFVIRRKAYALIKKAFDANGIKFAFPTVRVAGSSDAGASGAAYQEIERTRSAASARG